MVEATKYNVFPLDNSVLQRVVTPRPSATAGRNAFTYSSEALTPGKHTITFDFEYDGPGFGKGGTGVLKVDNNEVAKQAIPHTIPFLMTIDETFDVGADTRTGVDDHDYKPPIRFNGKLDKVTFNLGSVVLSEPERKAMHESMIKAKD